MATRNANNTDFGTQFGGTTLTVFDTLGAQAQMHKLHPCQDMEKSLEAVQKVSTFLLSCV